MSERHENPEGADVTTLLGSIARGDRRAAAELLPLVYEELRRVARASMARLPPGNTIQPTALVHEAYLQLVGQADPGWNGRAHFFGAAAQAMRQILVDSARRKSALKHGGGRKREAVPEGLPGVVNLEMPCEDFIALDAALDRLQTEHPRAGEVVMLRQFAGLGSPTIAEVLKVTARTVERDWRFARAWLHREIDEESR